MFFLVSAERNQLGDLFASHQATFFGYKKFTLIEFGCWNNEISDKLKSITIFIPNHGIEMKPVQPVNYTVNINECIEQKEKNRCSFGNGPTFFNEINREK